MSYREKNGQVVLTMSKEDYSGLSDAVGLACGWAIKPEPIREMWERLNSGNPPSPQSGNALKGEAAQGGTQETTKQQRLIDLENEVKYANAALGGNPAIQLCDRIRILKAGVAASQDTTQ